MAVHHVVKRRLVSMTMVSLLLALFMVAPLARALHVHQAETGTTDADQNIGDESGNNPMETSASLGTTKQQAGLGTNENGNGLDTATPLQQMASSVSHEMKVMELAAQDGELLPPNVQEIVDDFMDGRDKEFFVANAGKFN